MSDSQDNEIQKAIFFFFFLQQMILNGFQSARVIRSLRFTETFIRDDAGGGKNQQNKL